MKILHLATTYPLHEDDSNAAFVEALAEALCGRGHEVHVVLPWHPQLQLRHQGRKAVLHAFHATPLKSWHPWGYAQALTGDKSLRWDAYLATPLAVRSAARALRRVMAVTPIDVVHANWMLPSAPIARWALRGQQTPLVVSCHGSGVFLAERHGWAARGARWGVGRAAALTACSQDLTRRATAIGGGPEAQWIPYGVDVDCFRPLESGQRRTVRDALADRYGLDVDAPWVLAIGRLVYKKGFDNLVGAVVEIRRRAPTAQLIIAGDGPLHDELLQRARQVGVDDALKLVGAVAHSSLPPFYAAADVVAVPSVHGPGGNVDGLPNVFLEALASGAAVVASRVGGIPDIGRDGETVLLVEEGDVAALGAAIGGLLGNDQRRHALGAAARADAESRLGWDQAAQRFEAVYEAATCR